MRKTFATIIFGVFVGVLVAPLVANAQPMKAQECCKLKTDTQITKGKISAAGGSCVLDVDGAAHVAGPCAKDDPCVFKDGCTLGETATTKCSMPPLAGGVVPPEGVNVDVGLEMWGMICLISSVQNATNWIFYLLMVFVVVMIVIGGATYMMAAGNPEKAGKGKKIIVYGIIGLVIALVARLIPSVVKLIVGMGT